jgi:glutaminyl-peptide cyclotransferase
MFVRNLLPAVIAAGFALAVETSCAAQASKDAAATSGPDTRIWSGERAMNDIATQLTFTPRSLDTPGHEKTIEYIMAELGKGRPAKIETQKWTYVGVDGAKHALTNIIARFDPANPRRVIVGTHYDSIVHAYRDADNPGAPMPGANNSASGVALLLETARALSALPPPPIGVDMVFFDGEEGPKSLGAGDPNWMPLGSPYFAAHLGALYPTRKPEKGVVFDMVCYDKLKLNPELSSLLGAIAEVDKFWRIGQRLAPTIFLPTPTDAKIGDDQAPLTAVGIPSFLVIDFDYDPWFNTTKDTIDKCSTQSLEAVGRTLLTYLYEK